ncbi:PLP-dependent aminotransferase family protein [Chlorogloeopsis fritschii PCC 9212]|uniref:GntR family transcriptional regulator n=1 Tax=Chlorogloeopsis fritschii PCC 6912 TaxID=211165 RepID=A0A433NDU1_CHLFR|nr:PLP-dependent aminotransferase family protein [Chlorogloeopsis fritschii]RUR80226.1 GntR family transcriptional regulator [Chlorogloeopsis fritschii PCC 6912]
MANQVKSGITNIFELQPQDSTPLYRQLYERLRLAILTEQLTAGVQLPSTRSLASELGVSRNTVLLAYDQLLAEGYIEGKVGSGTTVAQVLPESLLSTSNNKSKPQFEYQQSSQKRLSHRGRALAQTPLIPKPLQTLQGKQQRIFRAGISAVDAFPHELWSQLIARRARNSLQNLLTDRELRGYLPLREAIAAHIVVARGVRCTPDQIIVVAGFQGGFDLAARVLLDPGDPVWMEDPGYLGARGALIGAGANLIPVPVDTEGLDVTAGMAKCPQARLVYVTPSHQFPLGVTMSLARRLALLEWANQNGAWVLEDDYDSEYRFVGRPLTALQGIDSSDCVIYFGTFSKVLFPALRLGYLVVPPDLVEAFIAARHFIGTRVPTLEQAVLADFMNEGHFNRHIRRMRSLYAERRVTLVAALKRELEFEIYAPETGMHIVLWLPPGMNDKLASQQAAVVGIDAMPLSLFSMTQTRAGLLLGYAAVDVHQIHDGVQRLATALRAIQILRLTCCPLAKKSRCTTMCDRLCQS